MQKKTAVQLAWIGLWFVFAALLSYLFFYNPGLSVNATSNETLDTASILISNSSGHAIRNIEIFLDGNPTPLEQISELAPSQTHEIRVSFSSNIFNVRVSAPFHKTKEQRFVLEKPVPFELKIIKPTPLVNQAFDVPVEICNNTAETDVAVSETHKPSFFGVTFQTKNIAIASKTCQTVSFSFTPAFSGTTAILFNAKTASYSQDKTIEFNIEK